jgi:glycosyltransferase involved in cell wall biosynthesis
MRLPDWAVMSRNMVNLLIGITASNDEQWIVPCISSLRRTLQGVLYKIVVLDNCSSDKTPIFAQQHGAEVISHACEQGEALNILLNQSHAEHTLLIHSDIIMLHQGWYDLLKQKLDKRIVLVSPNDIGLGNYLRSYGKGKPESSFMFFATRPVKAMGIIHRSHVKKFLKHPGVYPLRHFDFYGPHVTHRIPEMLQNKSKSWHALNVLPSRRLPQAWFQYENSKANWDAEWGYYDYGFGNFYSLDGFITHYHNWYSRQLKNDATELNPNGVPLAYIRGYSQRFLNDYQNDRVNLPDAK